MATSSLTSRFTPQAKVHVCAVPTLKRGLREIDDLVDFRNGVPLDANVTFDFSRCAHLSLNAVVLLGGLAALIRQNGNTATLDVVTMRSRVRTRLKEYGILAHFGLHRNTFSPGTMPFGHHDQLEKSTVMRYLEKSWLGVGAFRLSAQVQAAIMGNAWEVYANAFDHSGSSIGIINCGVYDKQRHRLNLSVMDLGLGIPANIKRFHRNDWIPSNRAMKWAFTEGTSTKEKAVGYSRGLGLHVIKEFIKLNDGFMEVFSNDGYVRIAKADERYTRRSADFL